MQRTDPAKAAGHSGAQHSSVPDDAAEQKQSQDITKRLVELFGDADQTSIHMQGSVFHSETGKFSGVKNEEARAKLRAAGLLLE